jgi:hypothetical protein
VPVTCPCTNRNRLPLRGVSITATIASQLQYLYLGSCNRHFLIRRYALPHNDIRRQCSCRLAGCLAGDTKLLCTFIFMYSSVFRRLGFDSGQGAKFFCTAQHPDCLEPTLLLFNGYRGHFPRGVKLTTFHSVHIFHIISVCKLLYFPYTMYFVLLTIKHALSQFCFIAKFERQFVTPKE